MKQLVTLAATRPLVALALGYVPLLLLMAALVVIQSGWSAAGPIMGVNTALVLVPLGCVWGADRLLAHGRTWWKDRLLAVVGGLVALFLLATGGAYVYEAELVPQSGWVSGPPLWLVFPSLLTAVNLVPLLLGIAVEAIARRLVARWAPREAGIAQS